MKRFRNIFGTRILVLIVVLQMFCITTVPARNSSYHLTVIKIESAAGLWLEDLLGLESPLDMHEEDESPSDVEDVAEYYFEQQVLHCIEPGDHPMDIHSLIYRDNSFPEHISEIVPPPPKTDHQ
jgi:hypothetical protein